MKIKQIITDELLERYLRRRAANRPIVRPAVTPKPDHRDLQLQTMKKPVTQRANSRIDVLKGYNAQLDNHNVFPNLSDTEVEAEMKSREHK